MTAFLEGHAAEVGLAAERIGTHVRRTPTLRTDDRNLFLKPECFQLTGSFKARGAFNAVMLAMNGPQPPRGLIAVSSGNHAQAVAIAARTVGVPAVILIPLDANPAKVAATRALGAEVIQDGVTASNREEKMRAIMVERGLTVIHPFDNWDVIHGAGTAARELLQDVPDLEVMVTPIGGGGLLSGTSISAKSHSSRIRVIGVEPETAADAHASWKAGSIQSLDGPPVTMADGVRTPSIGARNFETLFTNRLADEIVTVTEREIAAGVVMAWTRLRLALEPTGALPLAAHLAGKLPGGRTGMILSGGNADMGTISRLLST